MKRKQLKRSTLIIVLCVLSALLAADVAYGILWAKNTPTAGKFPVESGAGLPENAAVQFPPSDEDFTTGDEQPDLPGEQMPYFSSMEVPGNSANTGAGVLQKLWIPAALFLVLCDGVCVFLLCRSGKQKKKEEQATDMPELQCKTDDKQPKGISSWITAVALLLTFALIISSIPSGNSGSETDVNTKVLSAELSTQTISSILSGTGVLAASEGTAVSVPASVSVETYHVQNGDIVSQGDILATVSRAEAASAAKELQTVLDELDADLTSESRNMADTSVKAPVSGRVKEILVQAGDDVADVMYSSGALVFLSLDGLMSVDINSGNLQTGDNVQLTLSDGTIQSGKVAQILDSVATVTTSDEIAAVGDAVMVTDAAGNILGEGTLSIHSPMKITAFSGTVSRVCVSLNQTVSASSTLLSLKDTGYTTEYYRLLARRQELAETMVQLTQLSMYGYLLADCDGQVSGIPEDSPYCALNASAGSPTADSTSMEGTVHITLLSQIDTEPAESENTENSEQPEDPEEKPSIYIYVASINSITENTMSLNITVSPVNCTVADARTVLETSPVQQISYTYDASTPISDVDGSPLQLDALNAGDILFITISSTDGSSSINKIHRISAAEAPIDPENPDNPGDSSQQETEFNFSGVMPAISGMNSISEEKASYETYENEKNQILTITPQEEMTVDIQVDELDILSVQTGAQADISLDAVEGKAFTGTVSKIAKEGTNQGGNTKFTVRVKIAKNDSMLPGMNASVKIVTAESNPVPTIPVAALIEDGGHTYVYLQYDEKKDLLSDLTEVVTGLSDGDAVQILSGLSDGSTVYYRYADSIIYNFTNS